MLVARCMRLAPNKNDYLRNIRETVFSLVNGLSFHKSKVKLPVVSLREYASKSSITGGESSKHGTAREDVFEESMVAKAIETL